jgi:hypothetical protein
MKNCSFWRFDFQVLYSWKLWIQMLSVSARLTALSRNLLLCSTFSKWCMLCQDLCMDNKTTSGTAKHFSSSFRQIRLTNELEDMLPVILGELEGSREKIAVMTREDVEPMVASKPKEHHAVRSAAPLQRSAAPLQGQEHQNKEFVSPLSSSRAWEEGIGMVFVLSDQDSRTNERTRTFFPPNVSHNASSLQNCSHCLLESERLFENKGQARRKNP